MNVTFRKDSCFPCAVFIWEVENKSEKNLTVSLTFTFKNGEGSKSDAKKSCSSQTFTTEVAGISAKGVALHHEISGNKTTYGIGCLEQVRTYNFSLK